MTEGSKEDFFKREEAVRGQDGNFNIRKRKVKVFGAAV